MFLFWELKAFLHFQVMFTSYSDIFFVELETVDRWFKMRTDRKTPVIFPQVELGIKTCIKQ